MRHGVAGRPFEMYGSPVNLSECMGHCSPFRNLCVTGRRLFVADVGQFLADDHIAAMCGVVETSNLHVDVC